MQTSSLFENFWYFISYWKMNCTFIFHIMLKLICAIIHWLDNAPLSDLFPHTLNHIKLDFIIKSK